MRGNGSSMRIILWYFISKGAVIELIDEELGKDIERFFIVHYDGFKIPLHSYSLNFHSVFNSAIALTITNDKLKTNAIMDAWGIPTPATMLYKDIKDAENFIAKNGLSLIKPRVGAHGDGITLSINDKITLEKAVIKAQTIHPDVLLQQQVSGKDYRLLFIDYKFVAAVERRPASVIGDGVSTIRDLIGSSNNKKSVLRAEIRSGVIGADESRGSISKTPVDEVVAAKGEAYLEIIPKKNQSITVLDKANVSLGGETFDVTDNINNELCKNISEMLQHIGLPLCGVDVLSTDISSPLSENQSKVIEINSAPGLRLHEFPTEGQQRRVCAMIAESLITYHKNIV